MTKTGRRVVESKASAFYFTSPVAVRNARSHTRARTHMHVYTHTHACTHTRTRTRMYTHTHTHAHTSTRTDAHRHVLFSVRGATDDIAPLQGGPTGWARTWYDISTGVPASQRSLLLGGEMSMWTDTCAPAMHQDNTRHATCNTRHATCNMRHLSVFFRIYRRFPHLSVPLFANEAVPLFAGTATLCSAARTPVRRPSAHHCSRRSGAETHRNRCLLHARRCMHALCRALLLTPVERDADFGLSIGGMIWPRGYVAAAAFWCAGLIAACTLHVACCRPQQLSGAPLRICRTVSHAAWYPMRQGIP